MNFSQVTIIDEPPEVSVGGRSNFLVLGCCVERSEHDIELKDFGTVMMLDEESTDFIVTEVGDSSGDILD